MSSSRQQIAQPPSYNASTGGRLEHVHWSIRCNTAGDLVRKISEQHRAKALIVKSWNTALKPSKLVAHRCPSCAAHFSVLLALESLSPRNAPLRVPQGCYWLRGVRPAPSWRLGRFRRAPAATAHCQGARSAATASILKQALRCDANHKFAALVVHIPGRGEAILPAEKGRRRVEPYYSLKERRRCRPAAGAAEGFLERQFMIAVFFSYSGA